MPTSSDMTNTYTMFGVCGINPAHPAAWCTIHDGINDAEQIATDLEYAIQARAVVAGDFLVFDNATVHTGGENTVLEEHLWRNHGIYAVFLPARAPEWNPIEQVWNHMEQRLRALPLEPLRRIPHATARAAANIITGVTHAQVIKFYEHSGVIRYLPTLGSY
jgi:transposase